MNQTFSTAQEAIAAFGEPLLARRKTRVRIRPTKNIEVFFRNTGNLTAFEGVDYVMLPVDGSLPYPCKIDIFHRSWEETEPDSGVYQRKTLAKVIPVPEGQSVVLRTLEGNVTVSYPDYIAIGVDNEVYSNSKEWVQDNLDFVA